MGVILKDLGLVYCVDVCNLFCAFHKLLSCKLSGLFSSNVNTTFEFV